MPAHPTFREAFRFWLKLGFISFGGPTGQIAIMHTELVERKKWIDEAHFLHALNYCMLLPGPEATQLATYCGWLLHGTRGGVVAGVLFVLPSVVLLWALSWLYVAHGNLPWIAAVFAGLKPAVTAIVAAAVIAIGRRALKTPPYWAVAAAAFVAIFIFRVPFPAIVGAAAFVGWAAARWSPAKPAGAGTAAPAVLTASPKPDGRAALKRAAKVVGTCLVIWWAPVFAAWSAFGAQHVLVREGVFFSEAAMVTFGGAYAVLPYVGQQAVDHYGWLTASQMVDGLGLAETTPGPLIMVVQFVGFLGGWHQPGSLAPLATATLGAAITTWTTFVPCFLWIFLGAPYVERLRGHATANAALAAVTAAVVGVVLNLAVWFALHVFFPAGRAQLRDVDVFAVAVATVAFIALQRFHVGIVTVVVGAGVAGLVFGLV